VLKRFVRTIVPREVRNWLRSPTKSAEWLWDTVQFHLGVTESVTVLPGWALICHPLAYKIIHRDQILDKEQAQEFENFVSYCRRDMVLFDIGAHFGVFSLAAAHLGGRAIAVDPSRTGTQMIETLATLNRLKGKIQVVQVAVTDTSKTMGMLSSGVFSDGYLKVARNRPKAELTQCQAITVDQMSDQFGPPTHIKVDVEGHEAAVLRGAKNTLGNFSPLLFLELHNEMVISDGGDPTSVLEELAGYGYEVFAFDREPLARDVILAKPLIRVVAMRGHVE